MSSPPPTDPAAAISVVGISHHRTPIALREQLAVATGDLPAVVRRLRAEHPGVEVVLVATCNRVEIYVAGERHAIELLSSLAIERGIDPGDLATYGCTGSDAVRHLFRVIAGLESLVVGEHQILGQVKDAYLAAHEVGATGSVLNPLFQESFKVGKRVRSETRISEGRVSVGGVAVAFAQRIFAGLDGKTALVLGAGETAELVIENLLGAGLRDVLVANRSPERASSLVQRFGGEWLSLEAVDRNLHRADIVVGSTAATRPLVGPEAMRSALAKRRSQAVLLLDLAVPRDVDPRVSELDGAFLYTTDDLQEVVVETLGRRQGEVDAASEIVDARAAGFIKGERSRRVGPLIAELRSRSEAIRREELDTLFSKLELPPEAREHVERASRRIVSRLLHEPTRGIRGAAEGEAELEVVRSLFNLGSDDSDD